MITDSEVNLPVALLQKEVATEGGPSGASPQYPGSIGRRMMGIRSSGCGSLHATSAQRACRRAGIPAWSPRQLRHMRVTMIRQSYALEAAKAVLGHADTKTTEIYAE